MTNEFDGTNDHMRLEVEVVDPIVDNMGLEVMDANGLYWMTSSLSRIYAVVVNAVSFNNCSTTP